MLVSEGLNCPTFFPHKKSKMSIWLSACKTEKELKFKPPLQVKLIYFMLA